VARNKLKEKSWAVKLDKTQMTFKFAGLVVFIGVVVGASGAEFYVSPQGTPQGNGSQSKPWDIATALADNTKTVNVNNVVKPGDTIWLRGGTYGTGGSWGVGSLLNGTSSQPIVLRQYPFERAVINGGINAAGSWTTFWGFEIMNSSTNRTCTSSDRQPGLTLAGLGHRCINLVIHDVGHPGIGYWDAVGPNAEIYGCLLWNNGIYSLDPGWNGNIRGSGIYAQNSSGSRYITDTISFKNFTEGLKAYGEQTSAEGFNFTGNVAFGNCWDGIFDDSVNIAITNATLVSNVQYNNGISRVGLYGQAHQTLVVSSNYFLTTALNSYMCGASFEGWKDLYMTNNTFVELSTVPNYAQTAVFWEIVRTNIINSTLTALHVNGNQYFGNQFQTTLDHWRLNGARQTFSSIQAMGCDASGTYTQASPPQNVVILRPNKYEPGRAHLVVLNWFTNSTATVNISGIGLQNGVKYEVRDVQNYLGTPALTGYYDSTQPTITVPLTLTASSQLIGGQHHYPRDPNLHTDPVFNAFVILPVSGPTLSPASQLHIIGQ
jgi:hypothetical protein